MHSGLSHSNRPTTKSLGALTSCTNSAAANTVTTATTGFKPNANYVNSQFTRSLTQCRGQKAHLPPVDALVRRMRGEYRELPGLRLTFAQAYQ